VAGPHVCASPQRTSPTKTCSLSQRRRPSLAPRCGRQRTLLQQQQQQQATMPVHDTHSHTHRYRAHRARAGGDGCAGQAALLFLQVSHHWRHRDGHGPRERGGVRCGHPGVIPRPPHPRRGGRSDRQRVRLPLVRVVHVGACWRSGAAGTRMRARVCVLQTCAPPSATCPLETPCCMPPACHTQVHRPY
jgi:hypothetical protein